MLSGWLHIYMDNNQNFIKVGRISSKVEKNLNITLTSNPSIFLNEGFLDALASKRPNSYPNDIIEITNLVKKPNFVFYLRENKELVYAKTYILDHAPYFLLPCLTAAIYLIIMIRLGFPKLISSFVA